MESVIPYLQQQLGVFGYWFILFISFAESFVFTGWVVPGTVIVVIAGGLAAHGVYDFGDLIFFATLGAILGDGISYELGRKGKTFVEGRPFLQRQIEKGKPFLHKHQGKSIFLGRFIGWLRPIVPFVAGVVRVERLSFYLANVISAIAWAIAYLGLGYIFGAAWKIALFWATRAGLFLLAAFILAAVFAWFWRWAVRKGREALTVAISISHSLYKALQENPYVSSWAKRHARLLTFVRARFSIQNFSGLPLSLFIVAFVTSAFTLLGIIEDYLTGDPLALADVRITNLLHAFRTPSLLRFFYAVTLLAESEIIISLVFVLTILLWIYRKRVYILTLWLTIAGSQAVTILGKLVFHRPRPAGLIPAILEDSYSFPSGHATSVVAFYGFLAYFYIRNQPSWRAKVGTLCGAVIIIAIVDLSRLYLGVHYLSDVLAGNMVSLTILFFAISITEWLLWGGKKGEKYISLVPAGAVGFAAILLVTIFLTVLSPPWKEGADKTQPVPIGASNVLGLFEEKRLPRYTETLIGTPQEPLTFILIGKEQCVLTVFKRAKWERAENVSLSSTYRLAKTALLNEPFPTAPITPSFYTSFPHDFGFQKATDAGTVRSRHHARLWKINYETVSGSIFVGTASLDTGIKWGIVHSIDPAIDVERDLLVSDLERTGMTTQVERASFVPSGLGKNFWGDPFFTDGKLALVTLGACP